MESEHGSAPRRFILPNQEIVPVWVRFRNRVECVSRQKATHYLLDVIPAEQLTQFTVSDAVVVALRRHNYCATGVLLRLGANYGFYIHVDEDMTIKTSAMRRLASAAYSNVTGICYNTPTVLDTLINIFDCDADIRPKKFKGLRKYIKSKVTGMHHTHIRPEDVVEASELATPQDKYYVCVAIELLSNGNIHTEATVATILCYVLAAAQETRKIFLDSRAIWYGLDGEEDLAKRLKKVSSQVKSVHTADYEPLTELFELQVLMNRGIGHVSWEQERINRTKVNAVNVDPNELYRVTREMFDDAKKEYRYPYMTWDDYVDSRWEWVPGGSVHSQYDSDNEYIIPGLYTRNKFITVNMMPKQKLIAMGGSKPEIRAWTSTKYEWGKQRAIYGTDLRSTILTNFAMFRCEDVLKHKFPVGDQAEASKVHKRVSMMLDNASSFCFDYDDFNSQHSLQSMYVVLTAFRDSFSRNMSVAQLQAMDWVCESVKHMYAKDPHTSDWYHLEGTLLSGWRLTTFMNTVLNWAYMKVAGVFDIADVQDSVHNGDDVMISLNKVSTAVKIMERMRRINARAQEAKCNLFSISEFLRVEHGMTGKGGLGAQYLTRSCATLVHSRIESNEPISLVRLLEADKTRLRDLSDRTTRPYVVKLIKQQLDKRAINVFHAEPDVVAAISKAHRVCGGINDNKWGAVDTTIKTETSGYELPEEIDDPSFWPGVNDYTRRAFNILGERLEFNKIKSAVSRGSRLTIALKRKAKISANVTENIRTKQWERAMYRAFKGVSVSYYTSLSKFMAVPPLTGLDKGEGALAVNSALASADPLRALQILV